MLDPTGYPSHRGEGGPALPKGRGAEPPQKEDVVMRLSRWFTWPRLTGVGCVLKFPAKTHNTVCRGDCVVVEFVAAPAGLLGA